MKRILITAIILVAACLRSNAQVFIVNDNLLTGRLTTVSASVIDSLTNEPIAFASFYVIPAKDTTITNFTLTDAEGKAKLEDVPYGEYSLHVEMLGYKPIIKKKYFRDWQYDLGTIKLQVDENYLKAAMVSDVGNPIVVKQDTVEFNASSFHVGTNAMLKDLLKRMPGMEITDDGKVKFNGEEIDKLTVGGRTFFFGDQSTALNNLPASIVDKVRVIDRESESTRDTGLQDGSREKVLDVALKKEYEKGWFGNAGVKGGTTFSAKDGDPLRDDRGLLYSSNALVSAYSEKDQVTVIANGMNINDSNGVVFVAVYDDGERISSNLNQISSAAQIGVNANTSRIKDVETTVAANYKYGDSRGGSASARTTFQEDGDLYSTSEQSSRSFSNAISTNLELQKQKGKVRFHFRPSFNFSRNDSRNNSVSETLREGAVVNSSQSINNSLGLSRQASANGDLTFRDLGGKKDRVLSFNGNGLFANSDGKSIENSSVIMGSGTDLRNLNYLNDTENYSFGGGFSYGEPIGQKWTLSANARWSYSKNDSNRDAFDLGGKNEYYSSESHNRAANQRYGLASQYKFKEGSWIRIGASVTGQLNETFSKSFNIESTTGEGEWSWFLSPDVRVQHTIGSGRLYVNASGSSQRPGNNRMIPNMNITDPARPTIGNIYLKPYGNSNFSFSWNSNNREKFSSVMAYVYGNIIQNPITYARWYDQDGILYSIPVNSRKNTMSFSGSFYYTTPIDSKKRWFLSTSLTGAVSHSTSYQAKGSLSGLDKDTFDYSAFMDTFWGGSDGERFYSGQSGFYESMTRSFYPGGGVNLRYSAGTFNGRVSVDHHRNITKFSFDDRTDMNTSTTSYGAGATYTTKHEFELDTNLSYVHYTGYSAGYGAPEWQWDAQISKNIKAFTLSVKVKDILDQTRNLTRTVTANYQEDTYSLVMGRYILFGLKWNFGKMNAAHSQRAENAAWNMAF